MSRLGLMVSGHVVVAKNMSSFVQRCETGAFLSWIGSGTQLSYQGVRPVMSPSQCLSSSRRSVVRSPQRVGSCLANAGMRRSIRFFFLRERRSFLRESSTSLALILRFFEIFLIRLVMAPTFVKSALNISFVDADAGSRSSTSSSSLSESSLLDESPSWGMSGKLSVSSGSTADLKSEFRSAIMALRPGPSPPSPEGNTALASRPAAAGARAFTYVSGSTLHWTWCK